MKNKKNKGIIITGGTINSNNLAVGNNASINSKETSSGKDEENVESNFKIDVQNLISTGNIQDAIELVKKKAEETNNKSLLRAMLLAASNFHASSGSKNA